MSRFEVSYRPEANGPLIRVRRARRTLIGLIVGLVLLAIVLIGGSALALNALDIPLGVEFLGITALVLLAVSVLVALIGYTVWSMSRRRSTVPIRLSADGVSVWPMAGSDFLLPWPHVRAIQTSRQGIAILATDGTGPNTPGAMGLTDYVSLALLRKPALFYQEGLDWQSLQPVDVNELDAATRGFSNGHASVLRQ